jgi:putative ABC transport system substrate-binding protein
MIRREFITLLGGAAAWPLAANAQPSVRVRRIGIFMNLASDDAEGQSRNAAFLQGLQELGWAVGRNVRIDYRWGASNSDPDRMRKDAAELLALAPDVVLATTAPIVVALQQVSRTVPIAFATVIDPVGAGVVASLSRPGGNATGFITFEYGISAKLVPTASVIAVLRDPNGPEADVESRDLEEAGRAIGRQILMVNAAHEREFNAAFETVRQAGAGGLLIGAGPYFLSQRRHLVALAGRHAVPTMYNARQYAEVGGLISYGPSQTDAYRPAGVYVGRILKGEKAGDLPVEMGTKFELVINLATAKAFDFDIPPMLLARADEVIE